jgi:hypothetical protein
LFNAQAMQALPNDTEIFFGPVRLTPQGVNGAKTMLVSQVGLLPRVAVLAAIALCVAIAPPSCWLCVFESVARRSVRAQLLHTPLAAAPLLAHCLRASSA